jgi:hypothetical protein
LLTVWRLAYSSNVVIEIHCSCGKSMKVSDDLGGRRARCPACKAALEIPLARGETGCFCGFVITFTPGQVGTTLNCPHCDRPVFLTDARFTNELEIEAEVAETWPRCSGCGCRIIDSTSGTCGECGANLRTGKIDFRRSMPRARRIGRSGRPVVSSQVPVARLSPTSEGQAAPPAPAVPDEPPPPMAMPHIDDSHVDWVDCEEAQIAEELVDDLAAEIGEYAELLDFSPASLAVLDWVFDRHRSDGALLTDFVRSVACYLGEVITRNVGGQWRRSKDGRQVVAHLPGEQSFDPLGQIKKRVPVGQGSFLQLFLDLAKSLGV